MFPLLYKSDFKTIGPSRFNLLGRFTEIISGKVTEERNGDYLLEMELSTTDRCVDLLDTQYFVKARPNPTDEPQYFEIYDLQYKDKKSITVKAKHIKHNLYNNFLVETQNQTDVVHTPKEWWDILCTGRDFEGDSLFAQATLWEHYFKFTSNITAKSSMTLGFCTPCTLGDFMGGADGSLVDVFGGEYKYNNFNVSLLKSRGAVTSYHCAGEVTSAVLRKRLIQMISVPTLQLMPLATTHTTTRTSSSALNRKNSKPINLS